MPQFNLYIGIDYSGAETADSSCKGCRFSLPRAHAHRNRFSLYIRLTRGLYLPQIKLMDRRDP